MRGLTGRSVNSHMDYRVDRYKNHNIEILIDKLWLENLDRKRLRDSVDIAMKHGQGIF